MSKCVTCSLTVVYCEVTDVTCDKHIVRVLAVSLVQSLLQVQISKRPKPMDAFRHDWFSQVVSVTLYLYMCTENVTVTLISVWRGNMP